MALEACLISVASWERQSKREEIDMEIDISIIGPGLLSNFAGLKRKYNCEPPATEQTPYSSSTSP